MSVVSVVLYNSSVLCSFPQCSVVYDSDSEFTDESDEWNGTEWRVCPGNDRGEWNDTPIYWTPSVKQHSDKFFFSNSHKNSSLHKRNDQYD